MKAFLIFFILIKLFFIFFFLVCDLVQSGVWALFSSQSSSVQLSWLLSSYADHFHVPYFKLSKLSSSSSAFQRSNYTFNLYPKNNYLTNAILSLIESENSNSQFTFFYQHYHGKFFFSSKLTLFV